MDMYSTSSHVSLSGIQTRLISFGYTEEYATGLSYRLLSLLGGPKGSRKLNYFSFVTVVESASPVAIAEAHNPPERPDYASQSSPTVIENPAVFPLMDPSNDRSAVLLRLLRVNPGHVELSEDVERSLAQFAQDFRPKDRIIPVSEEDVVAYQKTAATRSRMERAVQCRDYPGASVSSFIKKEPYGEPKDPRNISNVCPDHNLRGMQF